MSKGQVWVVDHLGSSLALSHLSHRIGGKLLNFPVPQNYSNSSGDGIIISVYGVVERTELCIEIMLTCLC